MRQIFTFLLVFCCLTELQAADNFTEVYELFQAKCASCHSGDAPEANLDLSGSESEVYQALMNAEIQNNAANDAGYAMVKPGHVRESFLFRKINNELDPEAMISNEEGTIMPVYQPPLENYEIELVRQWIAAGAHETGETFSYDLIKQYYQEGGIANIAPLEKPAEGEGFQIYLEPIFLEPGGETEFYNKIKLNIPEDQEVIGMEANIDDFSHHFILYKYEDNFNAETIPQGRRYLSSTLFENLGIVFDIFTNGFPVGIWQYNFKHELPRGTAYFWDEDATFDLNYHVKNYSQTQVMAAQVYLNVYTQPKGEAGIEMYAGLIPYGENNPLSLSIPNTGEDITYEMEMYGANSTDTVYFWLLQSHTHQLGVDFDMYLRNEDGSLGEQIYEGMRDPEHEEYIGYYDYAHPPVLTYDDELLAVPWNQGLTHIATFNNSGDAPVNFGFTTNDEMFITYYHYTLEKLPPQEEEPTNNNLLDSSFEFNIAPNPFVESTQLSYTLETAANVEIKVYDVMGKLVKIIDQQQQASGVHAYRLESDWQAGVYFVQLTVDGKSTSREIIKLK